MDGWRDDDITTAHYVAVVRTDGMCWMLTLRTLRDPSYSSISSATGQRDNLVPFQLTYSVSTHVHDGVR